MKTKTRLVPLLLAVSTLTFAQDEFGSASGQYAIPGAARLLHPIPDGTPPPAAPPKPQYTVPSSDIISAKNHQQGGRTITVRQIKPITLPPPTPPAEPSTAQIEEFTQRLAEYHAAHPRSGMLFLSATVYRFEDAPPRTLVRYWPEKGGEIHFWSSADFALIAGGIQSFADTSGREHHIFMGWGNVDTDRMTDLLAANGRTYQIPEIPNFPAGQATYQIIGKNPLAEHVTAIQSLHDIYNNRHAELLTAYQGREQARLAHEAHLKANPPQPKDITIHYWHTKRPANTRKGGAR